DEVHLANTARSAGWILTEYNNQNSPNSFYTLGGQQALPASRLAITSVNGGVSPTPITTFYVTVQSQDANGFAANPTANTAVSLSLNTGTGTLGGTLAG